METKEAIKQLESRIFQWKVEGSDKIRKDKLTLSSEEIGLLIEDLTLKNVQTAEIEGLNKEIIEEQQKYQELFNSFPNGYLTTDEECRIKEANLACAQILGVERDLLVSKNFGQFIAPDSHSDFGIFYGDLLRTAARQAREIFLKNNSGTIIRAQLSGIAIIDAVKKSSICRMAITTLDDSARPAGSLAKVEINAELKEHICRKIYSYMVKDLNSSVNNRQHAGQPEMESALTG